MQQVQETFPKQGWIRSCFCVFVTYLLHIVLLSACTGKAPADVGIQRITAFLGETVLLPCNIPPSQDLPIVEWSKEDVSPNMIYVYRDGCEMFEEKNPDFRYRTSLILNKLQNGNLSLRVSNLQLSDKGTYWCKIVRGQQPEVLAKLELDVVAVSEPKLTVVPDVTGHLTVQCGVERWLPEPEITFLDDQGNDIPAEKPERTPPNITRKAKIQTATKRVTCRVHQQPLNLTREAEIYITKNCVGSFVTTITITFLVIIIVILLLFGLIKNKLFCNGIGRRSPVSHDRGGSLKIHNDDVAKFSLLNETETLEPALEDKEEEINQLTAKLNDKDEEIHQLAAKLNDKDEEIHQLAAKLNNLITGQNNVLQKDLSADDTRSSVDAKASVDLSFQHKLTGSQNNLPETKDQILVPLRFPRAKSLPNQAPAPRQRSSTMSFMDRNRYEVLEDSQASEATTEMAL